jgi:hypothetical protein
VKREDRRPYISGLDDIECSNYLRGLFKHDGLFYEVKRILEVDLDRSDYMPEDWNPVELSDEQIHRVLGIVEEKIREDLHDYSVSLEESKTKVDAYIDGLLDAHGVEAYEND